MRLQIVLRPAALHRAVGHAGVASHGAHAPAIAAFRRPGGLGDDALDLRRWDKRLAAAAHLSLRPSRPNRSKRFDHIDTVGIDVFIRSATSSILKPSSRNRMILDRKRSR